MRRKSTHPKEQRSTDHRTCRSKKYGAYHDKEKTSIGERREREEGMLDLRGKETAKFEKYYQEIKA